ncbi:MAG TPA: Lrp/AsnC family transcriptional regulator [Spongiibacteraceae bacterium]|nr:Lrp/AsnC family transcriptional regulator [Spongiibacteraceae bacterium]
MMPIELHPKDVAILRLLQQDAGLTSTAIAERLNLSQSPCWRRINHIEQQGIITRRVALLNRDKLGMEVVVFATVNLSAHSRTQLEQFEHEIAQFAEVVECYTMTGTWDYMLKIVTRDVRHYEQFIREHLLTMAVIREMHSHIAVTEIKNTTELPLDTQLSS